MKTLAMMTTGNGYPKTRQWLAKTLFEARKFDSRYIIAFGQSTYVDLVIPYRLVEVPRRAIEAAGGKSSTNALLVEILDSCCYFHILRRRGVSDNAVSRCFQLLIPPPAGVAIPRSFLYMYDMSRVRGTGRLACEQTGLCAVVVWRQRAVGPNIGRSYLLSYNIERPLTHLSGEGQLIGMTDDGSDDIATGSNADHNSTSLRKGIYPLHSTSVCTRWFVSWTVMFSGTV